MAVVMAVAVTVAYVGLARVATHRAQSAADLSALAAARLAPQGHAPACSAASSLAAENDAELAKCTLDGFVAEVTVTVPFSLPGTPPQLIRSTARAGPATPEQE